MRESMMLSRLGPCWAILVYSRKVLCILIGSPVNMQIIVDLYSSKRDSFILKKVSLDLGICRMFVFSYHFSAAVFGALGQLGGMRGWCLDFGFV